MTQSILFLDDCPARQQWAKETFDDGDNFFVPATIAAEAVGWLRSSQPDRYFDLVYLDHDLGGEIFVDSSRPDCGYEVVRWILANRPAIGKVVVHTMNTPAGNLMVRDLTAAGYDAEYVSFLRLIREVT